MEEVSAPVNAMHALHIAIQNGEEADALQLCMEELGNYTKNSKLEEEWAGRTALSQAVLVGNADAVKLLIKSGARLDTVSRMYDDQKRVWRSESPLLTACRQGDLIIVTLLVKAGANIDVTDNNVGKSALGWACARQHSDVAQFLIQSGADVNKADYYSETAITEVIGHRDGIVVKLLVDNGVYLEEQINYDRDTALLYAVLISETFIAQLFIKAGASVNVINRSGEECMTAVLWSQRLRDENLVGYFCSLLIEAGYKVKPEQLKKARTIGDDVCASMLEKSLTVPLSLASQCRLAIRQTLLELSRHTSILDCIEKVPLPGRIKSYLALDEL